MKKKHVVAMHRNWGLVFMSSIIIVFGLAFVVLAVTNIASFGWWSLSIGLIGLITIGLATMSIIKNDPAWILIDLIIPF
jgi:hypothetical protein